jgi:long-chain acyl-CoA synthetase
MTHLLARLVAANNEAGRISAAAAMFAGPTPGEPVSLATLDPGADMNGNLAYNLIATAQRHPDRPALLLGDRQLSYAELDDLTARVAALLRERGLQAVDRVGIMLPNVPEFALADYGVLRAGGVVVPMNVLLKHREVAFYVMDSGAKLMCAYHQVAVQAREGAVRAGAECLVVEPMGFGRLLTGVEPEVGLTGRDSHDTAVILYTSGTTGQPRAPSSRTPTWRSTPT